jgi:hypothetical protein
MIFSGWPLLAVTLFLAQAATEEPACNQAKTDNKSLSRTLSNGVVITVRPVSGTTPQLPCEILVQDRNKRTIFADRGFSTEVHPATGRDIDNDGRPDAVLGVDAGGGNGCCWEYPVISFNPTPRVLVKLPAAAFDFETTAGKTLIWTRAVFYDLGPDAADAPIVETVREFRPNGFIEVTQDYCKRMLAGELRGPGDLRDLLNAVPLRSKQASRSDTGSPFDREQTRLAATALALQQIYCGQINDASQLVLEVWPAAEQNRIRQQIKDAVNSRWPDLAKKLGNW